ncbi:type II secretion system protein [Shewanella sp. NIFS-20-20]|uniref:type II secretion system protein n=1 Tax=Shewanella sp. NIFS-20-20 TaxID=2853806 RepID=UPI001C43E5D1|nr:type II secretion system protein [Shewanella sp. NIFS-20-20]MBV7317385.1 type II secretion system GspH family protein [Shewanella sp. NIFS-20-20]
MQQQKGFTLIELVVVIIILGILAVTAAPKFINLQSDARASALQGLKGAIQGANSLIYSKASLEGVQGKSVATDVNIGTGATVTNVSTIFGYMDASQAAITSGTDISTADWTFTPDNAVGTPLVIVQQGSPDNGGANVAAELQCRVTYAAATATSLPVITVIKSGC